MSWLFFSWRELQVSWSVDDGVKTDFASRSGFAGFVFGDEAFDGIEDDAELLVVFIFEGVNSASQIAVGVHEPAQLDEGAHDGDVDLDGTGRAEDAGEHGDTLLGEGVRGRATELAAAWYHRL
jgi:hypothetical protein